MSDLANTAHDADHPIVRFRDVEKTYDGETNVVEALHLDVLEGEFLTLLGPSGSGKTTTLMMLAGFEEPTAGEILLRDRSILRVPPFRRNMGVVFQNYALFPHMTVAENVGYPLRQRRLTRADIAEKVRSVLDMVELGQLLDRRPAQLSGGQQQRVALARALVFEPDIVLMDEPLGALDKRLREQMQVEIKRLHDTLGMTFVYVTHDQSEALTMSDRVAVFNDGRIQQIDAARTVYEAPMTGFVANFIGENNTLPGAISSTDGSECRVRLDSGATVGAANVLGLAPGQRTHASIRPERLILAPGAEGMMTLNVREMIYFGDHLRVILRGGGIEIMAKAPIDQAVSLKLGDSVSVTWDAQHCRALDASEPDVALAS
ncbi:MAG: ABC transporter ATP-binding protein [Pseudomonadota bacterium]